MKKYSAPELEVLEIIHNPIVVTASGGDQDLTFDDDKDEF